MPSVWLVCGMGIAAILLNLSSGLREGVPPKNDRFIDVCSKIEDIDTVSLRFLRLNPLNPAGRFCGFEVPLSANRWKCWFSRYFGSIPDSYFVLRCLQIDQIKSGFLLRECYLAPFCHFCHFIITSWNLCSKAAFLVSKLVCFVIGLADAILPE
jgi:hypothetical protein